jgi:3-phenylpropionate/trans-cinnamate dioxygenase ferredoxin subunit
MPADSVRLRPHPPMWDHLPVSSAAQSAVRLVAVDDLGDSHVTVVEGTPHGDLAVGMSEGKPFATSNRCRHLFASLGKGRVTGEGCLECPSHHALYDVGTGKMVRGPQGAFKPLAGAVKATSGARSLKTYPVELRDGAIWLLG